MAVGCLDSAKMWLQCIHRCIEHMRNRDFVCRWKDLSVQMSWKMEAAFCGFFICVHLLEHVDDGYDDDFKCQNRGQDIFPSYLSYLLQRTLTTIDLFTINNIFGARAGGRWLLHHICPRFFRRLTCRWHHHKSSCESIDNRSIIAYLTSKHSLPHFPPVASELKSHGIQRWTRQP